MTTTALIIYNILQALLSSTDLVVNALEVRSSELPEVQFNVRTGVESLEQRLSRVLLEYVHYLVRPLDDHRLNGVDQSTAYTTFIRDRGSERKGVREGGGVRV